MYGFRGALGFFLVARIRICRKRFTWTGLLVVEGVDEVDVLVGGGGRSVGALVLILDIDLKISVISC